LKEVEKILVSEIEPVTKLRRNMPNQTSLDTADYMVKPHVDLFVKESGPKKQKTAKNSRNQKLRYPVEPYTRFDNRRCTPNAGFSQKPPLINASLCPVKMVSTQ
jgi:hypothetical protein